MSTRPLPSTVDRVHPRQHADETPLLVRYNNNNFENANERTINKTKEKNT